MRVFLNKMQNFITTKNIQETGKRLPFFLRDRISLKKLKHRFRLFPDFSVYLCIPILCTFLMLTSCGNAPYTGNDALGADEFVIDSYKIREGKFSILQLEGKSYTEFSTDLLQEYKDTIQEDDILEIVFYNPSQPEIASAVQTIGSTIGFQVISGKISLPGLEPIEIQGLTLEEARKKTQTGLSEETQLFFAYKDRPKQKVELAGLVDLSTIPIDGHIRLFETLSLAKLSPQANLFKSYVVRENRILPVDLYKLVKEGDMSQNIVMRGGDKIYIAEPSASTFMVLGEVGQECVVAMPNGFMSLKQALAEARGIPYTGNKSYIQVIRGNILNPKIYTLTWDHLIHLPNDSLLLIPGDIVYVATTPITEWNRFVTQLLPTLIGIDLVTKGIKSIGVNVP